MILSSTAMMDSLTGTALEVCELMSKPTTLPSLQLEHTDTSALLTSSDMKEFASSVFFSSLVNIESSYVSSIFLTLLDRSWSVMTAFLLKLERRLSPSRITSGVSMRRTE